MASISCKWLTMCYRITLFISLIVFLVINLVTSLKPNNINNQIKVVNNHNNNFNINDAIKSSVFGHLFPITESFSKLNFITSTKQREEQQQDEITNNKSNEYVVDGFTIREADYHDIAAIASLRIRVFYPEQLADTGFHYQISEKVKKRMHEQGSKCLIVQRNNYNNKFNADISKLISNNLFHNGINSNSNSNTIGTVEFSPSDFIDTAYEHEGSYRKIYVSDLGIRQDARRLGLATKMLMYIEEYCLRHGYDELYLHVEIGNMIARNLYQKLGYMELSNEDPAVSGFTTARLQKSADGFVMLKKKVTINSSNNNNIAEPTTDFNKYNQNINIIPLSTYLNSATATASTNNANNIYNSEKSDSSSDANSYRNTAAYTSSMFGHHHSTITSAGPWNNNNNNNNDNNKDDENGKYNMYSTYSI